MPPIASAEPQAGRDPAVGAEGCKRGATLNLHGRAIHVSLVDDHVGSSANGPRHPQSAS
jgi:hypothetical protein